MLKVDLVGMWYFLCFFFFFFWGGGGCTRQHVLFHVLLDHPADGIRDVAVWPRH